ncbi:helix-turn-helix domain-containing protein [Mammaliicoccus sciuri]|uniref:pathogenicity island protein n=1 Tax=Mammaliicoccus sciuri TaxID=1296 RepID=UPI0009935CB1|nr:pathogenicity island protein [Mammaliicoccus sciuri]OOV36875.1 pathogenicity island protein [Staphylococcus sp. MB371]WQJ65438.1 helix-turn-helix domain-containing protein [Mammaliicoccus sciuri]
MKDVTELPTKQNTVTDPTQIVVLPIYAKISTLPKLIGISKSSIYRILREYDEESNGIENMYVSLSATLTIVDIKKFQAYLNTRHKTWL